MCKHTHNYKLRRDSKKDKEASKLNFMNGKILNPDISVVKYRSLNYFFICYAQGFRNPDKGIQ